MRDTFVADPAFADVPAAELLSDRFADVLAQRIAPDRAMREDFALPAQTQRDTVYLTVVDGQGNACSLVSSLLFAFGKGRVCPHTGIALHNRGAGFRVQPGKRPLHTLVAP